MRAPRELLWRDGGIFMASADAGLRSKIAERLYKADRAERHPWADGLLSFLEEGQERHPVGAAELAAAGRIANKSGLTKIDKRALWQAILKARDDSEVIDRYRRGPRSKKCAADLQKIQKAAHKLQLLLSQDNDAMDFVTNMEGAPKAVLSFLKLEALITVASKSMKEISRDRDPRAVLRGQRVIHTKEWLAGVELPRLFEEFGGNAHTMGYPPPDEMIAFVEAAMKELCIRYAASTIKKAIRELQEKRRVRKQHAGQKRPAV
jgi:hypothetical protein